MSACAEFARDLERALERGAAGLETLAATSHARECAACRGVLERERKLEELLGRVPAPLAPIRLAERVLRGLAPERGPNPSRDELEELLGSLPEPRIPADLSRRVLAGLAAERVEPIRAPRPRWGRWLTVAAAAVLATLWLARGSARAPAAEELLVPEEEELLHYAVERWELLNDEDLDVWLASLDPLDEILLEYTDEPSWPAEER